MRISRSILRIVLLPLALSGCGDGLPSELQSCTGPPAPAPESCRVWRAGLYDLHASVSMASLTIEAGVTVRAAGGVRISVDTLIVNGTAAEPVSFIPLRQGEPWSGLMGHTTPGGTAQIRHARIQGATNGIVFETGVLHDTEISDVQGAGVTLFHGSELRRVTILRAGGAGAQLGSGYVEDLTIRDSGAGLRLEALRAVLRIRGAIIEDNAGDGIFTAFGDPRSPTPIFEAPVRITRNQGYPLVIPFVSLRGVLSEEPAQVLLTGNTRDTIIAYTGSTWGSSQTEGDITLRKILPVRAVMVCQGGILWQTTLAPGALLILDGLQCPPPYAGRLPIFAATAAEPATIRGNGSALTAPADREVTVSHARLSNLLINLTSPATFEDVDMTGVSLRLEGAGSRVSRVVSTAAGYQPGAPYLPSPGIEIAAGGIIERTLIEGSVSDGIRVTGSGVLIRDCSVRGSAAHGIHVLTGGAVVARCNLEGNAGSGVHNATADPVDARDNWWGDPGGPAGPGGDGVSGPVDYVPFRTAPVSWSVGNGFSSLSPAPPLPRARSGRISLFTAPPKRDPGTALRAAR